MKVGIITYHYTRNYGGCLQAAALQKVIGNLGFDVYLIDYRPPVITDIYKNFCFSKYVRDFRKSPIIATRSFVSDIIHYSNNHQQKKAYDQFYQKYYRYGTKTMTSYEELKNDAIDFDICFTGSDQVWNIELTDGFDPAYYLMFGRDDMVRASYAASLGSDRLSNDILLKYKDILKGFDAISVRERDAEIMLGPYADKPIITVLDPTLLLSEDDWRNFVGHEDLVGEPYIFVYALHLDEKIFKITETLSRKTHLPIATTLGKQVFSNEVGHFPSVAPDEFVRLIINAEYVVTNSFHGTAFSVNFRKQFFTIMNSDRNSRMESLLNQLDIDGRMLYQYSEEALSAPKIRYEEVHKKLNILKQEAIAYIKSVLYWEKRNGANYR